MSLSVRAHLGPYRVVRELIGFGGEVYKADDSRLDRTVALKVLPAAAVRDEVRRRLTEDPFQDGSPTWSRDGRFIYFNSNREGEWQVWKIPRGRRDPSYRAPAGGNCRRVRRWALPLLLQGRLNALRAGLFRRLSALARQHRVSPQES